MLSAAKVAEDMQNNFGSIYPAMIPVTDGERIIDRTVTQYAAAYDRLFIVVNAQDTTIEVKTDVYRFTKNLVTYGLAADSDYRGQVTDGQLTLFHGENKLTTLSVSGLDTGTISDVIGALAAYDLLGGTMSSAIMA